MADHAARGCSAARAALLLALLLPGGWPLACERGEPAATAEAPGATASSALAEATSAEYPHLTVRVTAATRVSAYAVRLDLEFANAPSAADAVTFGPTFATAPEDAGTIAGVFLFDEARGRKYFVLRDDGGRPRCSTEITPVAPGETRALWALFPSPPPGVAGVTVHVPHVGPLEGVPIG